MTLTRITSALGAVALGGVLVASTYGAHADAPTTPRHATDTSRVHVRTVDHFQAPTPHKYGANGMRMGLHCETSDLS